MICIPRRPTVARCFALLLTILVATSATSEARDGRLFDSGVTMTDRADGAPEQLDKVLHFVGDWDVELRVFKDGEVTHTATGQADVNFMNRGHAVMERFRCPDFDGQGLTLNSISFLAYSAGSESWLLGTATDVGESIQVHSGSMEDDQLVLHDASRPLGGAAIELSRVTCTSSGQDALEARLEVSTDLGKTWELQLVRSYMRRSAPTEHEAPAEGFGSPASGLPEEARQFDFLVGEWSDQHDMNFGGGPVSFPANGSAVHCLDGHGILEFGWYDVDPSLPDAATSIVRIYNRAMRRWESMYITNRFNGILHFGGVREDDRIVLHQFAADRNDSPISYWIFHDMSEDSYSWHAESSTDGGVTWTEPWKIRGTRRP